MRRYILKKSFFKNCVCQKFIILLFFVPLLSKAELEWHWYSVNRPPGYATPLAACVGELGEYPPNRVEWKGKSGIYLVYDCAYDFYQDGRTQWTAIYSYDTCDTGTKIDLQTGTCFPLKGAGSGSSNSIGICPEDGNPINRSNGIKRQRETDFVLGSFRFQRIYASYRYPRDTLPLGANWSSGFFSKKVIDFTSSSESKAQVVRDDNKFFLFIYTNSVWTPDADVKDKLVELLDDSAIRTGWKYYDADNESIEVYDKDGLLASITTKDGKTTTVTKDAAEHTLITDYLGRSLTFTYDANERIVSIHDSLLHEYAYAYDANNNLVSVTYPDGNVRQYHYENTSFPNALTGITDENGVRYATFAYDENGKAIETKHVVSGSDVYKYALTYASDYSQTTVTDPLGTDRTYNYTILNNSLLQTSQSQPGGSGCGEASSALTYDANGNVTTRTDWNGNVTTYAYDLTRNLETQRVEASGKAEAKTTSTQWHSYWRLPVKVAEPKKVTTYVYNGDDGEYCAPTDAAVPSISGGTQPIGVLCSKTEQATTDANGSQGINPTVSGTPRVWQYTYNTYGRVLTATDPNNHTTTNTYYAIDDASVGNRGNLHTSTNAAGHTTTYSNYDANGRVGSITDANGLTTNLTYSPRGWLTSKVVTGGGSTETTTYTYDGVGQMTKVSLPDGAEITYTYDDAHRLTQISDKLGNSIHYTLDAMGNRTKEEVKDPSGNLARQVTRVYDALNRLEAITGGVQ